MCGVVNKESSSVAMAAKPTNQEEEEKRMRASEGKIGGPDRKEDAVGGVEGGGPCEGIATGDIVSRGAKRDTGMPVTNHPGMGEVIHGSLKIVKEGGERMMEVDLLEGRDGGRRFRQESGNA